MYKLIIEDDEGKTTVVPLIRDEITIGRKEGNTIRLTERNVSRRHAKLLKSNGTVYIEDLQSYNGIRLNGDRIAGRAPITEGDRVQIGDYQLALKVDKGAGAPEPDEGNDQTTPFLKHGPGDDGRAAPDAPTRAQPILNPAAAAPTTASPTISAPDAAERPARLVVVSSNFAGKEFRLDKPQCVIGRTDENDVVINHRSISRHHAKIVREGGRYQVVDLGSANGVRVNGEDYGKVELRKGDLIDLGHVRLRFVAPSEDFVFARDAQVVDVAGGDKKGSSKLIIAAVLALVVLGGVAVVALRGSGGDGQKGDGTTDSKLGAINLEVDRAITALEWDTAIAKTAEGLALDGGNSALRDKRTKAESEKKAQVVYDLYTKAAKGGENESAVMRYLEIPESSVYHDKAQETWPVLRTAYIREHTDQARSLLVANNCADAKRHVEAVLMVDDTNAAVIEIANKCGQSTAPPRRGGGGSSGSGSTGSTPRTPRSPTVASGAGSSSGSSPAAANSGSGGTKVSDPETPSTPPAAPVKPAAPPPTPTAPAAGGGDSEIDAAMKAAEDAWVHAQYSEVIQKSSQILKKSPNNTRAWRLFGASSCATKDAAGARQAWNHLGTIERNFLQYMCNRSQIKLP